MEAIKEVYLSKVRYKVEIGTIKGVGAVNREAVSRVGAIKEAEAVKEVEEAEAIREVEVEAIKEVEIYPVLLN